MKFFTKKGFIHKIIISVSIILVTVFSVPQRTYGGFAEDLGSNLLKELLQVVSILGDIAMGLLNNVMLGADGVGSAMLPRDDINLTNTSSWLYLSNKLANDKYDYVFEPGKIDTKSFSAKTDFEIPNMLYSPENIFANKIAALDVNFLRNNTYQQITDSEDAKDKSQSSAKKLSNIVSSWYKSFRNIAIVGLLSVLIYIGIRILISSTAADKAKYKENLKDWFVALCLVFAIHFIMSGILMITDKVTEIFDTDIENGIRIKEQGKNIAFKTNLTGLIRFRAQSSDVQEVAAYTIVYVVLVFYTYRFTFIYFKRFLYMAFFTMISPLVALTYPIDKMGDGQAQAFNLWFKEYTMNAVIQPVHLILYTVFVSSAAELAQNNIIYAVVAIAFLIPAEKFIKQMFKLDKASTPSGLGSFAGGALAMQGLNKLGSMIGGNSKKGGSSRGDASDSSDNSLDSRIRMQERPTLGNWGGSDEDDSQQQGYQDIDDNNNVRRDNNPDNDGQDDDEQETNEEEPPRMEEPPVFEGQEEMDSLGEELDQYDDNDIYMNPELGAKQMRYQELDAQKRQWEEEQEQQRQEQIRQQELEDEYDEPQEENEGTQENQNQSNSQPNNYDTTGGGQHQPQRENDNINLNQKPDPIKGWKRKLALKGAKKLAKGTWKLAKGATKVGATLAGIGIGATIGAGAALSAGEDPAKVAQAMATGGALGSTFGKGVGSLVDKIPNNPIKSARNAKDQIVDKKNDLKAMINEERYGSGFARYQRSMQSNEVAKKIAERDFKNNKKEQNRYKDMAARIYNNTGRSIRAEDLMKASLDYQQAGVTDEDQIERGLTLEAEHGGVNGRNHQKMVDIMDFANSYSVKKDSFTDEKKRTGLEGVVQSKVKGTAAQQEVMSSLAEAYGLKDYYQKVGKIGKPAATAQQAPQNGTETAQPTGARGRGRPASSGGAQTSGGQRGTGTPQPTGTRGRGRPVGSGGAQTSGGQRGTGTAQPTGTRGRGRPASSGGAQTSGDQRGTGTPQPNNPNGGSPTE